MIDALMSVATLLAFALVPIVLPMLYVQRKLWVHYQEWVKVTAYWHRASDKWIIYGRVFYLDEFHIDVWFSIFWSVFPTAVVTFLFATSFDISQAGLLVLSTMVVVFTFLLVFTQLTRYFFIDEALCLRRMIDPEFSSDVELRRLFEQESGRKYIRKVVPARRTPRVEPINDQR